MYKTVRSRKNLENRNIRSSTINHKIERTPMVATNSGKIDINAYVYLKVKTVIIYISFVYFSK